MISDYIKLGVHRTLEMLLVNIVISAITTFACVSRLLNTKMDICIAMMLGVVIFVLINIRMLRECNFVLRNKLHYFLVNISSYLVFAAITFLVYFLCSPECFTWIFSINKFMRYIDENISVHNAMFVFHTIGLLMIILAPIGMKRIFDEQDAIENDID